MNTYCHVTNGLVDNRADFADGIPSGWPDASNWIASDVAQIGWAYAGGVFSAPEIALPAPTEADYANAIQAALDAKAKERGYRDDVSIVTYSTSTVSAWKADAALFIPWRDSVWTYAYEQLAAVKAGTRAQPSVANFVTEIESHCPFEWPQGS